MRNEPRRASATLHHLRCFLRSLTRLKLRHLFGVASSFASAVDHFGRRAVETDGLVMGKHGFAVDRRRHFPPGEHAERVGKRPAQCRRNFAGDAHRQGARGRPVAQGFGKCGAITRHSASVRSVWYRATVRLCCRRVVDIHMANPKSVEEPLGIMAGANDATFFKNCR
jgi:hypothetical protein